MFAAEASSRKRLANWTLSCLTASVFLHPGFAFTELSSDPYSANNPSSSDHYDKLSCFDSWHSFDESAPTFLAQSECSLLLGCDLP